MGGPGSGRRPTKAIAPTVEVVRDANGVASYGRRNRGQSVRERVDATRSPRQEIGAVALLTGLASDVREAARVAGLQGPGSGVALRTRAQELADAHGLDLKKIVLTVGKALDAKRQVGVNKETGESIEAPDNDARLRAADIGLKIHDAYPRNTGVVQGGLHYHLHLDGLKVGGPPHLVDAMLDNPPDELSD